MRKMRDKTELLKVVATRLRFFLRGVNARVISQAFRNLKKVYFSAWMR